MKMKGKKKKKSLAIDRALLRTVGRTPEASMASALYTDVKKKGTQATFAKVEEGLFGLREWPLLPKGGGDP